MRARFMLMLEQLRLRRPRSPAAAVIPQRDVPMRALYDLLPPGATFAPSRRLHFPHAKPYHREGL